jgi:hypothetical protein
MRAPSNKPIHTDAELGIMGELPLYGWRQLPWPVDDNYLGRLKAYAGRVREAGLL